MKSIGLHVRYFREKKFPGYGGQALAAKQAGVKDATWSYYEAQERLANPTLAKISKVLGITIDELLAGPPGSAVVEGKEENMDEEQSRRGREMINSPATVPVSPYGDTGFAPMMGMASQDDIIHALLDSTLGVQEALAVFARRLQACRTVNDLPHDNIARVAKAVETFQERLQGLGSIGRNLHQSREEEGSGA